MHGAGNDYVFLDEFRQPLPDDLPSLARAASRRHFAIGSDGLIAMAKPRQPQEADVRMQMFNADGTPGAMCGNGVRCIALWMMLQNRCADVCRIETQERIVTVSAAQLNRTAQSGLLQVTMGAPVLTDDAASTEEELCGSAEGGSLLQTSLRFTRVSMGNPHAVIFTDRLTDQRVHGVGAEIERHSAFPDRTNVEWVVVNSAVDLTVRVWERGSGETLACGSGACAAVVAGVLRGHCPGGQNVKVRMPGGVLTIRWSPGGPVLMTGPAQVAFVGEWNVPRLE